MLYAVLYSLHPWLPHMAELIKYYKSVNESSLKKSRRKEKPFEFVQKK